MSEKDIKRWHDATTPFSKAPHPWTLGSGGSWDMLTTDARETYLAGFEDAMKTLGVKP